MTNKEDFTGGEWKLLGAAPYIVGFMTGAADMSAVSFAKEMTAMGAIINEAGKKFGYNELLRAVLKDKDNKTIDEATKAELEGMSTSEVIDPLRNIALLLDTKATREEAEAFKRFLYEVAEKVAEASGEGFLGTGEKTSDAEYEFLVRLSETLGL